MSWQTMWVAITAIVTFGAIVVAGFEASKYQSNRDAVAEEVEGSND